MRLLLATPLYPPEPGGPATYARALERHLPQRGIDLVVVKFTGVRRYPKVLRHIVYFFRVLKEGKYADCFYALDSISVGVPTLLAAWIRQVPLIVRIGGLGSWERATEQLRFIGAPHELPGLLPHFPLRLRVLAAVERFVLRRAQRVVVPSAYMKKALRNLGIPDERVVVVYNGTQVIAGHAQDTEGCAIVSAGRFVSLKRFEVLIDAMARVVEELPNAKLVLVGEGPTEKLLKERVTSRQLQDSVLIHPPLPHEELLSEISKARVFALPSMHETFSNLILESMAVGTPVVSTDVGGTPEIITHDENGLLVHPGNAQELADAILSILRDPAYARRLAQEATKTLDRFREERGIGQVVDILEAVH